MSESRDPVIGICGIPARCRYGEVWDRDVVMLQQTYLRAVTEAGGMAVLLAPTARTAERPGEFLDLLDGLLLAGGSDIDPGCYGAPPHPELGRTDPVRDRAEIALAAEAVRRGLPLLGVCRGMQVLNVALGGDLIQHLPDLLGDDPTHLRTDGVFEQHPVHVEAGTRTAELTGPGAVAVSSHHHQAVGRLGAGLTVTARASGGRVVEAVECADGYAVGVQWHPEEDPSSTVIAGFVRRVAELVPARA